MNTVDVSIVQKAQKIMIQILNLFIMVIWIRCEAYSGGLEVEIRDKGEPFDPNKVPEPKVGSPLEKFGPRGAGVFLMRKLMDDVRFEFFENETVLRMKKRKSE